VWRTLRRFAGNGEYDTLVDLGGGEGYFASLWPGVRRKLVVDAVTPALAVARNRGLLAVAGDVRRLPLRDGRAELVVSSDVLEHLTAADIPAALAEMARVLAPGGVALLHTSCYGLYLRRWLRRAPGSEPLDADDLKDGHRSRLTPAAFERALAAAGFKVKRRRYYKHLFHPLAALAAGAARPRAGGADGAHDKRNVLQSPIMRGLNNVRAALARLDMLAFGWWLPGGAVIYKLEK